MINVSDHRLTAISVFYGSVYIICLTIIFMLHTIDLYVYVIEHLDRGGSADPPLTVGTTFLLLLTFECKLL